MPARAAADRLNPANWHEIHQPLSVATALDHAAAIPPAGRLVVCHGDACAPNTLLGRGDDGPGMSASGCLALPAGEPTWPSPPGVLTGTADPAGNGFSLTLIVQAVMKAGACAFLDKRTDRDQFVGTIVAVVHDRPFVTPSMAGGSLQEVRLSARERRALQHLRSTTTALPEPGPGHDQRPLTIPSPLS